MARNSVPHTQTLQNYLFLLIPFPANMANHTHTHTHTLHLSILIFGFLCHSSSSILDLTACVHSVDLLRIVSIVVLEGTPHRGTSCLSCPCESRDRLLICDHTVGRKSPGNLVCSRVPIVGAIGLGVNHSLPEAHSCHVNRYFHCRRERGVDCSIHVFRECILVRWCLQ